MMACIARLTAVSPTRKYRGVPVKLFQGQVIWSLVQTSSWNHCQRAALRGYWGSLRHGRRPLRLDDLGATWNPIPNGGNVYAAAGRATLAVGAPGDAVVYAFAEKSNSTDQLDLFRSTTAALTGAP